MFNIDEFASNLGKQGIVKPSHYDVVITRRDEPNPDAERSIQMRCLNTDMPGVNVNTIEHSYNGPQHKIATGSGYVDLSLSIILSTDFREKRYFESWRAKITGRAVLGDESRDMFALAFYEDYIGKVRINLHDEQGRESYAIELHDAYPISIGTMQLAWASGNEYLVMPITFAFHFYTEE